jgi:DNA-binding XRE family transcriptional regulator
MTGSQELNAAGHFGRQLRKSRHARGMTVEELARVMGVNAAHLGRIEAGKRPPTERIAMACDAAFPERGGWFCDWYRESRTWSEVPAAFRDFGEYEDTAPTLLVWMPGIFHGLPQCSSYARSVLATSPGVSEDQLSQRLTSRMARQQRVLFREEPPQALFLVDELSLYRCVGSVEVMAEQMGHLAAVGSSAARHAPTGAARGAPRDGQRVHHRRRCRLHGACRWRVCLYRRADFALPAPDRFPVRRVPPCIGEHRDN